MFFLFCKNLEKDVYKRQPLRLEDNYNEIRNNRKKALAKPDERTEYLTKNMNFFMPSNSGEEFITIDKLRLCKNTRGIFDWNGKDVYLGLDLAMTNDNTSVSMVTMEDDMIFAKSWAFIPDVYKRQILYTKKINDGGRDLYYTYAARCSCANGLEFVYDGTKISDTKHRSKFYIKTAAEVGI